ncbi:MAG: hypothetical protein KDA30_02490 [Phycisphaerales bacterium]|nr:hypothetical protein [Phycisphaerales bacterium]
MKDLPGHPTDRSMWPLQTFAVVSLVLSVVAIVLYSWVLPRKLGADVIAQANGETDVGTLRRWMMVVVTIIVLGVSLYVILSDGQDEGSKKWAFGAVGTIMGFWLKQD